MEGCGSEMLQIACKWEVVTLKCCNAGNSMQMFFFGGKGRGTIPLGGREILSPKLVDIMFQ